MFVLSFYDITLLKVINKFQPWEFKTFRYTILYYIDDISKLNIKYVDQNIIPT